MKLFRLLPIIIIIAVCVIFFSPTLTRGLLPVPTDTLIGLYHPWLDRAATTNPAGVPFKNFLITDPVRQQIPWRKLVIDNVTKGTTPLWNPYSFSGTPLMANIQAGTWYPLNLVFFFLPFYVAWTILVAAQPILAALFLYLYLRNKKITPIVCAFAGVVWAFCGFSIAWLTWGTILQTALWLPLILLAIDKVCGSGSQRESILWTATLALSGAFAFFAGHAQVALYIFVFAGLYGVFQLWQTGKRNNGWWLLGAVVAGVVVSSLQWVPLIELLRHSPRIADTGAWLKDGWFLPWQNLAQFVAPDFFGNPATLNYWGIWNYGEFIGYVGIIPLILALYAIITRKDRFTGFLAVFTGIVFLFLLPTPLARLPYRFHIPVLFTLQPTRLMVLIDFGIAVLAGLGLESYIKNPGKKILIGIAVVGMIIAGLWTYASLSARTTTDPQLLSNLAVSRRNLVVPGALWAAGSGVLLLALLLKRRWTNIFVLLVISVTVFDLFRFGWKFTPFTPVEYFFPVTNAISFLQSQVKPFRVMSLDNRIMPPNVNAYYGIESIEGYDPLYDARYEEFIAALNRTEANITPPFGFNRIITSPTIDSSLVRLLNVKYILTLDELKRPDLELMYREGNTRIYFYKKSLPRAYAVGSIIHAEDRQHAISMLYDKKFNPEKTAIVEDAPNVPVRPLSEGDSVRITSYTESSLSATCAFAEDHFVVIANLMDPHWRAAVDGIPARIYRTDYLFIGIPVPKGNHIITLSYE